MKDTTEQSLCFIQSEGYLYMCGLFDYLPIEARKVLANAHLNICSACFEDEWVKRDLRWDDNLNARIIVGRMMRLAKEKERRTLHGNE